mgnify:CR=1 FL=1
MKISTKAPTAQPPRPKAVIVGVYEIPATSPSRLGETDTLVVYKVGNTGTFQVKIPKSNPTPQEIQAAIKEDYKKKGSIVGTTIEL